jgi:hypothetical protein
LSSELPRSSRRPAGSLPFAQLLAHAFGFGLVLGVYLERMLRFPYLDRVPPDGGWSS